MPGRFPLSAVSVVSDPFCEDGFCYDGPDNCIIGLLPNISAEGEIDLTPGAVNTWYELWHAKVGTPIWYGGCLNYTYTYWSPQRLPLSGSYSGLSLPTFTPSPDVTSPCNVNDVGPNSDPGILRTFTNTDGSPNTSYIQGPRNFFSQFQTCPIIEWRVELVFTTPPSPNTLPANQVYCTPPSPPPVPPSDNFDPEEYLYFRWSGLVTSNQPYEPSPTVDTVTSFWEQMIPGKYGYIDITAPAFTTPSGSLGPWVASYRLRWPDVVETCSGTNWAGSAARVRADPSSSIYTIPGGNVYHPCYEPTPILTNTTFQIAEGVWEFTNDRVTVLAVWAGL